MIVVTVLGQPVATGPYRIAMRVGAERARVAGFNATMASAGMTHRTAMWRGVVPRNYRFI